MLIAILPIIAIIVGILMWALCAKPILAEAGKILFFWGVGVTLFIASRYTVKVFP